MTRIGHVLGMLFLAVFAGVLRAEEAKAEPKQIQLKFRLFETTAEGKTRVLSEPTLVTLEGRPCSFMTGGETAIRDGAGKLQYIEHGHRLDLRCVKVKEDRVDLDVTSSITAVGEQTDEAKAWQTRSIRMLTHGKLGKTMKIEFPQTEGAPKTWVELTAEIAPPQEVQRLPGAEVREAPSPNKRQP